MIRRCRSVPLHTRQPPGHHFQHPARLFSQTRYHGDDRAASAASSSPKAVPRAKLIYPDVPSSTHHADLASFVSYAKRTGLDERSTVYVGTHYEYSVAAALRRYGFHLVRVGGASDRGTDLVGTWVLPSLLAQQQHRQHQQEEPARVLVQCKAGAGAQRVGPQHVRELEGAFVGAPAGWRGDGVLGLLVGERPATKGVRDALGRSRWPVVYVCCSRAGAVSQMLWNRAAEEAGLEGYAVVPRRVAGSDESELVLMHNGRVVKDLAV
ncbi:ribonucleoside-diphosphate reductase small chain [Purpureocillium lavendulum]|uniref:Ribonucleoside-diphosphate reductase small chain n=1 Tax=Purpureocillium lavendulum TaxID=1247861 RepID=A0AB34G5R6_9HYPO|nr:ribonucleoside-diphosphate reductase small chain [Purpureocillium lavendulum]